MSIVIDIGSYTTKYGEAGSEVPAEVRSCLCTPRFPNSMYASLSPFQQRQLKIQQSEQFLQQSEYRGLYRARPIVSDNGRVRDVEDIFKVLEYVKSQLKQRISKLTLIIPPLLTEQQQHQIQDYCFEAMKLNELLMSSGGAFALYTSGRVEGLLLQVGDTSSFCQAVLNNQALFETSYVSHLGGRAVSQQLLKQIYTISTGFGYSQEAIGDESYDLELVYQLKHKLAEVQNLRSKQIDDTSQVDYKLPDGSSISLKKQQIHSSCEVLFDSCSEQPNVMQLVQRAVNQTPLELHQKLFKNIVITGGTTCITGFAQRVIDELKVHQKDVDIFGGKNRQFAAFQGASACSMLSGFSGFYTKRE